VDERIGVLKIMNLSPIDKKRPSFQTDSLFMNIINSQCFASFDDVKIYATNSAYLETNTLTISGSYNVPEHFIISSRAS
jgi:hypothetical protein